jgi:hypothetical protein
LYWGERFTVSVGAHSVKKALGVAVGIRLEGRILGNRSILPDIERAGKHPRGFSGFGELF